MSIGITENIRQKPLGVTGLTVSEVALGTVELGLDYGIQVPGKYGRPSETEAVRLLQESADAGVTLFDTAPSYGEGEVILGRALGHRAESVFATKIQIPRHEDGQIIRGHACRQSIEQSLQKSLAALKRDVLDIVQIHNATVESLQQGDIIEALCAAKQKGMVRLLGASVYQEEEALTAIQTNALDVLQVAYNILDQRMAAHVFPAAQKSGVAIMTRSALLKGVLTDKAQWLPSSLSPLKDAVGLVKSRLNLSWETLPQIALRFCLSHPDISTVLVGVRTMEELRKTLETIPEGGLEAEAFRIAQELACDDGVLLNPNSWSLS